MMRKALLVLLILLLPIASMSVSGKNITPKETYTPKPLGKLGIVFFIDGLDARLLDNISTPNLDYLANHGLFLKSKSVLPSSTTAGVTAITTGAYPNASGVVHTYAYNATEYHNQLPDETPTRYYFDTMLNATTIFETLTERGVTTILVYTKSKQEVMLGESKSVSKAIYVNRNDFFSVDPHESGATLEQRAKLIEYMTNITLDTIDQVSKLINSGQDAFIFLAYPEPDWSGHAGGPNSDLYKNIISIIDSQIGRIINRLNTLNLWERTFIIAIADHGYTDVDPQLNILNPDNPEHLPGLNVEHVVSTTAGTLLYIYLKNLSDTQKAVDQLRTYPWTKSLWTRIPANNTNGTLWDIGLNNPFTGDIVLDIKPPYYASKYANDGAHGGTDAQNIPVILSGGALDTSVSLTAFDQLSVAPALAYFFDADLPSKCLRDYIDVVKPSASVSFSIEPTITEPNSKVKLNITYEIRENVTSPKIEINVVDQNNTIVDSKVLDANSAEGNIVTDVNVGSDGSYKVYIYIVDGNNNILGGQANPLLVAHMEKPPRAWGKIGAAITISLVLVAIMIALPVYLKKRQVE
ncbi:MAG: alkaline phosphatase family protein [Candidatus Njordarchaeia archaeon]